jgi:segregation and condensation protein B
VTAREEMEAALEAVLFASSDPVPRTRLLEIFDEGEREQASGALDAVLERYAPGEDRGVMAEEVAGGVRLVTRPEIHGWLRRFFEVTGSNKLSMAALETLAIIAYRQPMTGPEIQELRSVNPSGVLKTLLERHLIRIAGRKEVVGKPFLYCTTREFLVQFGLKSLRDLPPLEEIEETLAELEAGADGEEAEPDAGLDEGPDREETILRRAAELDEADAEADGDEAAEDEPPERETAGPRAVEEPAAEDEPEPAAQDEDEPAVAGVSSEAS